ncbi:MAG: isoamylase early set domain-containing protein [Anaerolineae bacterium]|nr:isoamylase early set domain-containing protein [Anaerolineae bacterium]
MISKRAVKNSNQVKVTFVLPEDHPYANGSFVVGDFSGWEVQANPLQKRSNGTYSSVVTLEKGKRYTFRYVSKDGYWFNADDADAYEPNNFGGENGILLT